MNQSAIVTIGMLAGGLGLFLLAVGMITDGLKLAAGNALRDLLGRWTRSPGYGIATGASITALVQSSSAVTVATIGFVNAGLMAMPKALGVIYGANIGTTMTGWLVALIGFNFKAEAFALPLIGVGMLLRLTGGDSRRASVGTALAGFGLFFVGIDILKDAFEGLAAAIELQKLTVQGVPGVFAFLAIGIVMTVLTQASSATIAITLTAVSGGIIGLYAAAAMVIGANVGTTSTAIFAVIGATPNAKRVAAAHVIFNVLTGIVALAIFPGLFFGVQATGQILGLQDTPAMTVALFHTLFNVLGVLLMWPLTNRLAHFLEKRFVSLEEIEARPKYLDKTVAVSPTLALNALALEMTRIAALVRRLVLAALSAESGVGKRLMSDFSIVKQLCDVVDQFIARLQVASMSGDIPQQLSIVLQTEQHLLASAGEALNMARAQPHIQMIGNREVIEAVAGYRAEAAKLMALADPEGPDFSVAACDAQLGRVLASYKDVKGVLLHAGAALRAPIPGTMDYLEQNNRIKHMTHQMIKAIRNLDQLHTFAGVPAADAAPVDTPVPEAAPEQSAAAPAVDGQG